MSRKFPFILLIILAFSFLPNGSLAKVSQERFANLSELAAMIFSYDMASGFPDKKAVTPFIAFKEKVSAKGVPTTEDLNDLVTFEKEIKLGYTNDHHGLFFKFSPIKNIEDAKGYVLTFNHPLSGLVEVYRREGLGEWQKIGVTGSEVPYGQRLIKGFQLSIPLEFSDIDEVSYFLRRKSMHRFDASAFIQKAELYLERQGHLKSYYFFYMGAFLALILYNLFLYFSSGEKNYLYYFLFGLSIHMAVLGLTGFIDYLLNPFGVTGSKYLILFSSSSLMSSIVFAISYNNLIAYWRGSIRFLYGVFAVALFIFLASLGPWSIYFGGAHLGTLIDIVIPVGIIGMMVSAYVAFRRGHVLARFYLISWFFMFGGALIFFSHYYGIVPRNFFTSHAVMWGNLVEMLVVSLGLAYKISTLDREKKEAFIMAKGKREYERLVRVLLHDIGNPMSLIKHYTLLQKKDPNKFKEKEEKAWDKINFGVKKIDEIITFHRQQELNLSQNFRELHIEPVNLVEAMEQVKVMFEESLEAKKLRLEVKLEDGLSVKAERVSLINEVLNNIISNAIKFSFEGGNIFVHGFEEVGHVYLKLEDQGKGISDSDLKNFLEDKGIASQPGTKGELGTGYGLYLVKSYMDLYGGQVFVQSTSMEKDRRSHGTAVTLMFKKPE